ncbi:MAG: FecR family protein [Spirochaetia bacterium]|nr:FecR family protein [Spirochaetia bacterium]
MNNLKTVMAILFLAVTAVFYCAPARAETTVKGDESYSIAYINDFEGECELKRKGTEISEAVQDIYVPLYAGDTAITGSDGKLEIVFDDATILKLDKNSKLTIKNLTGTSKKRTVVELIKGKVMAVVKKLTEKEEFTVRTKMAMAAVKGTEFIVDADGDNPSFGVYEGAVEVSGLDMDGNVLHKIVLNKDEETKVIKTLHRPDRARRMGSLYKKRYSEINDLRGKIEYIREMRKSGKHQKYKIERRLKRIENMKKMYGDNPANYGKLSDKQKEVVDAIIGQEGAYRQAAQDEKRQAKSQRLKAMLKKQSKKTGEQTQEQVSETETTPDDR